MKKTLAIVLTVIMMLSVFVSLAGCGKGDGTVDDLDINTDDIYDKYDPSLYQYDGDPVTISWAHWDSTGPMEEAVSRLIKESFEKRYPTITVNLEILSDYESTYSYTIAANKVHDVFLVPDGAFKQWSGNGGPFQNLNSFLSQSDLLNPEIIETDMFPGAIDRYKGPNDSILAIPKDIGPHVMYYNKEMFDAAGVPYPPSDRIMSIEEATTMWKALTDSSKQQYGLAGLPWEGLVWSAGGEYLNADRTAFPTDAGEIAGLKRALQYVQDAMYTHKIIPTGAEAGGSGGLQMFRSRRAATVIEGRWEVTSLRQLDFGWDVAFVPAFEGERQQLNCWSGSAAYAVCSYSENKLAAWKLVEYIGSKEGQEILAASGFAIPLYDSLNQDETVRARELAAGPQNYDVFVESAKHQPAGTHFYHNSKRWKELSYDAYVADLLAENAGARITVDEYITRVRTACNNNL